MTNLQKQQTQKAIGTYCEAKDISKRELATRIGVSPATISNVVNGKWDNIDAKLWMLIWNYVNPEHLQGVFQTTDFKAINTLCNNAIKNKYMIGLTGDTGMGKTTSLKVYAKGKNVYYYYIDATVGPKIFLKDLLREMGVQFEGSLNAMLNRIADELNTQAEPLLIIDESAKLSDKMLLTLHSLRDKTMYNAGIILAGMPDFKNTLLKHVNKGTTGYAEFYRRINIWHEMKGLTPNEIKYILEANGIKEAEEQREYKAFRRFGDLTNAIKLHQQVND